MKYQIKRDGVTFKVIELQTELCVAELKTLPAANVLSKQLNSGYAFNGFTPTFFTKGAQPIEDIYTK